MWTEQRRYRQTLRCGCVSIARTCRNASYPAAVPGVAIVTLPVVFHVQPTAWRATQRRPPSPRRPVDDPRTGAGRAAIAESNGGGSKPETNARDVAIMMSRLRPSFVEADIQDAIEFA